ncbi:hypothetical protein KIL84_002108 [Mauremys mutica]|uniref:IRF tryptophan pentad repeat domain-containing protein n=1 Tax=Mauremys mutica TaxID=74926 RepID=A0A9D3XIE6_9SAUR|nr:hypothetical protein KIL84_002108 [Mauremys mutica]
MGTPKPLIVPWLRKKLDDGCYPGVRWLDQGRTQFRVPWKHGLRQDASTEDFQLFRDWAIDSGSYRPDHDAPAPSVWKRNFRSALNRKPGIQDEELDDILNSLALSSPDEDTFFEVRVYYRGHLVLQTLVPNPQGFRLVPPSAGPSPCPELADVALPEPGVLRDGVQASYTARLLQGLGAGVLLRVEGPALCATRLGRLHAYWGRTETPEPGAEGGELSKEGCTPVYDLPRFVRELIRFMEGQGSSPTYELWLCLGEAWPDMGRSWKKKLIMVQVVPTALQTLHQLSQAGGASSLRAEEPDLRISDSLGEAGLLGALRGWEERMETQPYG